MGGGKRMLGFVLRVVGLRGKILGLDVRRWGMNVVYGGDREYFWEEWPFGI